MSGLEARILELGAETARVVLRHGWEREAPGRVIVATAWQVGLELGLTIGIEDAQNGP